MKKTLFFTLLGCLISCLSFLSVKAFDHEGRLSSLETADKYQLRLVEEIHKRVGADKVITVGSP